MTYQRALPDQDRERASADAARDAERAEYLARLRKKLEDAEFRAVEGFPIGEDEDILALSDPPYYTACPNPFLPEIVERWRAERAQLREALGLPDDSADNGDPRHAARNAQHVYHREPFASDVSEGKSDPIYRAHSYHTKVPHKAVMRYILHYTDPGDIVFDGFCGTGMTGVAAQLCADKKEVQSLGYRVKKDATILDEKGRIISHLGARKTLLTDLCPAATFIAHNYNTFIDVTTFGREAQRILREVEEECGWMYETSHPHCDHPQRVKGHINYMVWSDVFVCSQCGEEMVFWDVAVDRDTRSVRKTFSCPSCGVKQTKAGLERAWEVVYDHSLGQTIRRAKRLPVLINYFVGNKRFEKAPDTADLALVQFDGEISVPDRYPSFQMMFRDGKWGDQWREGYHTHITHTHHFYFPRALWVLSTLYDRIVGTRSSTLLFWFNSFQATLGSLLCRYNLGKRGNGPRAGTLYIASLIAENNLLRTAANKLANIGAAKDAFKDGDDSTLTMTHSASTLPDIPEYAVDYIFVDPPFGGNLMYSELNFLWEAWLRVFTNNMPEAIVSQTQRKRLPEYQRLMEQCFCEFYRILKPGRWMTIEFHNSRNRVWNAIQEALLRAGFVVADVRTFDKRQGTFNQVTAAGSVKQDLIISAYKPRTGFERRFLEQAGSAEGAWAFVRQHLVQLPIVVRQDGALEVVTERQLYLLYDRMVAFHIQRGATVPLSAAEFYAGLGERFVERDGMYFLPDQVPEYDRARMEAERVAQLALFVSDEKSTIQWLRQQLDPNTGGHAQTYQEIQPQFLRQLHQARHEALPELGEILAQNFLQDKAGRWYVPDPNKAGDLEKLRQRALLREFAGYVEGRGRLRQFRTEAVRAGFADAWRRRDYATVVKVAERLPERVLQEDPNLLMYYDNATLRTDRS